MQSTAITAPSTTTSPLVSPSTASTRTAYPATQTNNTIHETADRVDFDPRCNNWWDPRFWESWDTLKLEIFRQEYQSVSQSTVSYTKSVWKTLCNILRTIYHINFFYTLKYYLCILSIYFHHFVMLLPYIWLVQFLR